MKRMKNLVMFLVSCVCLSLTFCLGAFAADGEKAGIDTFTLVSLIIGGVLIIVVAVLCIVKREKLAESVRAYKSEMKKITWYPWKSVWRSTLFVLVAVAATAIVVGMLDIVFFELQHLLVGLVG